MAAKRSISMNQYIVDLIDADLKGNNMPKASIASGIEIARIATPKQKKVIEKASKTINEIVETIPGIEKASKAKCKGDHYMSRKDCGKIGCPWA